MAHVGWGRSELWRQCAHWLVRCQVLADNHRVTLPGAVVFDLAQTLRDGVILCHLINNMMPGCVDLRDVSLRPQMSQFLCLKNIRTFLQACQRHFQLRPDDLFESDMLFDVSNFEKVLQTLSKLSKTPKAQEKYPCGFPHDDRHLDDGDIYQDLEDLAIANDIANDEPSYDSVGLVADDPEKEEIYEDLFSLMRKKKEQVFTKAPVEKRDYIIKELVETEKNYVDALQMIDVHFYRRLSNILSEEDKSVIFRHIPDLLVLHTSFHSDLLKSYMQGDLALSSCFLHYREKLTLYGDYCSNLPQAQQVIDEVVARKELVRLTVMECEKKANDGKFKLRDLLSVPMQRVLKYHLLLQNLNKETAETDPDKLGIQNALEAMLDLALYINEVKRDNETLDMIEKVGRSITDLVMPENTELHHYGRLIHDGEMKVKQHRDERTKTKCYCFLFDKVMLMCKSLRGDVYSYKDAILLSQYRLDDSNNTLTKTSKDKFNYTFLLVEKPQQNVISFSTKTEESKRKWIDAINLAQDNVCPKDCQSTDHKFHMMNFDSATYCSSCKKLLRGAFYQGYACSAKHCEVKVHKECIKKSRPCRGSNNDNESSLPPPVPPRNISNIRVKAVKSFRGVSHHHLSFAAHDEIHVLRGRDCDEQWMGRNERTKEEGLFPKSHVTTVQTPSPSTASQDDSEAGDDNQRKKNNNNNSLYHQPWYVGEMDREMAERKLKSMPTGTFLIRLKQNPQCGYAISVRYGDAVKHILINISQKNGVVFVSENNTFQTVKDLVKWYQANSLEESFKDLNTTLAIPYKSQLNRHGPIGYCVAKYPYSAREMNMLTFERGDRIAILSKAGEDRGWWKGELSNKIGYFPKCYVEEDVTGLSVAANS